MSMYPIASATVGAGGTASVTFSSIPSAFTHLQIRFSGNTGSTGQNFMLQLNGDTGTNYIFHYLTGNGSGANSGSVTSQVRAWLYGAYVGTTAYPTVGITDILDYTNTNKYKTLRTISGSDGNGSGEVMLASDLWLSTAAITSISLIPNSGTFTQYSTFQLYGISTSSATGA